MNADQTSSVSVGIAVVEDNDTLRDLLVSYLEGPQRRVFGADCGEALNAILIEHPLDIVILDLNLPHEDGLSIAQRLRRSHPHLRIVMLTARVRPIDRSQGYDVGADVYLTKPTSAKELDAVVRNLSQRTGVATDARFVLHRASRVLTGPQRRHAVLTNTECALIELLALAPTDGIPADTLLDGLQRRTGTEITRENLAVSISRLRSKMLVELEASDLIETLRNYGYRLVQPVSVE